MFKPLKLLVWILIAGMILGAFDQAMTRLSPDLPGWRPAQSFYVDFRQRLMEFFGAGRLPATEQIDRVIDRQTQPEHSTAKQAQRYLYADDQGVLQFADSLEQVPQKYRAAAQPLDE